MAFVNADLYNIYSGPPGFGIYVYKSDTDSQATTSAVGYFNNDDDNLNIKVGDTVFITGVQGGCVLEVTSISAGVITTTVRYSTLTGGSAIFAELSSSVDQIPADTNPVVMTYNTQDAIEGLTHSTSVNAGEVTVITAGVYELIGQPQIGKDSGGVALFFDMFLQIDTGSGFVDIANTNVKETVKDADVTDVLLLDAVKRLAAGDKIRIMQKVSSTTGGLGMKATAAVTGPPTVPATPSVIFTMLKISGS